MQRLQALSPFWAGTSVTEGSERDPSGPKPVYEPTPEERALHELTHLPKADWCESCAATRSREDIFETSKKKYDGSLVSVWISSSPEHVMKKTPKM